MLVFFIKFIFYRFCHPVNRFLIKPLLFNYLIVIKIFQFICSLILLMKWFLVIYNHLYFLLDDNFLKEGKFLFINLLINFLKF